MKRRLVLILHRVRSAYNVGSIFRTADGAGVGKIYLTGFTQAPFEEEEIRETKAQRMLGKTALGAQKYVSWEKKKNISEVIFKLKKEGFLIVALEQRERSIDYRKFKSKQPVAIILGNEPRGIDARILKKCDKIIEIPMYGKKKSLNVSVAAGIVAYELSK